MGKGLSQKVATLVSRLLTPWPGRLEHPKMFRYLPQSGASPLWPVLFVWVLLNSCCGELKYANFSEINSTVNFPSLRISVDRFRVTYAFFSWPVSM